MIKSPADKKIPDYFNKTLDVLCFLQKRKEDIYVDLKNNKSKGKRRKKLVYVALLASMYIALKEVKNAFENKDYLSMFLLTRYIYESVINFKYIFVIEPNKMREKIDAFYYFSLVEQKKIIGGDYSEEEGQWRNSIKYNKIVHRKSWSGRSFSDIQSVISKETTEDPKVKKNTLYKGFSVFSHPTLFSLEVLFEDNMDIKGLSAINMECSCYMIINAIFLSLNNNIIFDNKQITNIKGMNKTLESNFINNKHD